MWRRITGGSASVTVIPPVPVERRGQRHDGADQANLICKNADLLRGPYQPNQYGDVILPFTILRRLDCILYVPTKDQVLAEYKKIRSMKVDPGVLLKAKFKLPF